MADPGGGGGGLGPNTFRPNWGLGFLLNLLCRGPKGWKKIFWGPDPPYMSGSGWPAFPPTPPYLKMWIHHWILLLLLSGEGTGKPLLNLHGKRDINLMSPSQCFSAINVNVNAILSSCSSFKHAMLGFRVFWPQFHQMILITILLRPSRQAVYICLILSLNIEPYSLMMTQYCQWKTRTAQCMATFSTAGLCRRYAMLNASGKNEPLTRVLLSRQRLWSN